MDSDEPADVPRDEDLPSTADEGQSSATPPEPSSDPSRLLASAAEALEEIDDPAFEGALNQEPVSRPAATELPVPSGDYSKTVLSIETPVAVVLAKKKISVGGVINLVPGSMLTFDAHCDEPLTLEAGGHAIAFGETVKIGDKFGLRIRQLLDSAG